MLVEQSAIVVNSQLMENGKWSGNIEISQICMNSLEHSCQLGANKSPKRHSSLCDKAKVGGAAAQPDL